MSSFSVESGASGSSAYEKVGMVLQDGAKSEVSYEILEVLGYGTYGCIYLAKVLSPYSSTVEYRAIKCLSKKGLSSTQLLIQSQEIDLHLSVSSPKNGQHPNIVDMSSVIETKDSLYLVMEYCSGGDLFDAITSQHAAANDSGMGFMPSTIAPGQGLNVHSDRSVLNAMAQIISALAHSHQYQVFHRDLKPENILVAGDGTLKLADFGLATKDRISSDFGCGSSFYMAPEQQPLVLPGQHRRPYLPAKSDVWALGIIFLNMRFGRNPWKTSRVDTDSTFEAFAHDPRVLDGMFPELTGAALHFLHRVLCVDPSRRADCAEALELIRGLDSIVRKDTEAMSDCESTTSSRRMSSSASSYMSDDDGCDSDSMFHMEGEFHQRKDLNWSQLTASDKSWSKLADEDDDEMDFSSPVEFSSSASDDSVVSQAGFVKLSDLFKSNNYNNSASVMMA
ncbi:hypothetical protein BGZ83_001207 [Gryganskiella cystojenkinii]|nr:hypothetical protein BGZ83_001207 [Gryganskiella cystojenkinii]